MMNAIEVFRKAYIMVKNFFQSKSDKNMVKRRKYEIVKEPEKEKIDISSTDIVQEDVVPSTDIVQEDVVPSTDIVQEDIVPSTDVVQEDIVPSTDVVQEDVVPSTDVVQEDVVQEDVVPSTEVLEDVVPSTEVVQEDVVPSTDVVQEDVVPSTEVLEDIPSINVQEESNIDIKEVKTNEGENIMKHKQKLVKDFVQVEKLETDESGVFLYLMKIADIPIRPYITEREANRVADYMKLVVGAVINKFNENNNITGKDLVKIEQPSTKEGVFYLMAIANLHIRGYIDGYETLVQKNFMVGVVNEIIKQLKE